MVQTDFYYHISDDNGGVDSAKVVIEVLDFTALEDFTTPDKFGLHQNYPNPFNPSTTIVFTLPKSEFIELKVFNVLGKEVANIVSKELNTGKHTYTFNGRNLASGVYYYVITAGDYRDVKKMILLR